ncbi:MAG: hypothetical protein ACR2M3_02580 [Thermomicrobiales bacterium]
MENPMAFPQHYADHQRQVAWINDNDWQFERPKKQYPVRIAIAKALIHLATLLAPTRQETRAA